MNNIAIIIGSTRPGRKGLAVAKWVMDHAALRTDTSFELVDIVDFNLPLLNEANAPSLNKYELKHTKRWAEKIAGFDGFIFVTAEYNHGIPAALKNALDYLYVEWNNKAAGFVSYGTMGGVRAIEQLRQVMAELQVADVRSSVNFLLSEDFVDYTVFKPSEGHEEDLENMLDQLIAWSTALKTVRRR